MSVFSLGVLLAPIIGPVVGGWITDNWTWPWIFYINIPFGIAAIIACHEILEDPPYAAKQKNVQQIISAKRQNHIHHIHHLAQQTVRQIDSQ